MSATALCEEHVEVRRERRSCAGPRGITIGRLLARAYEDAQAHGIADCPVCGGSMECGDHAAVCVSCGSRLS